MNPVTINGQFPGLQTAVEYLVEEYGFDYVVSALRRIALDRHEDYNKDAIKYAPNGPGRTWESPTNVAWVWSESYRRKAEALLKIEQNRL